MFPRKPNQPLNTLPLIALTTHRIPPSCSNSVVNRSMINNKRERQIYISQKFPYPSRQQQHADVDLMLISLMIGDVCEPRLDTIRQISCFDPIPSHKQLDIPFNFVLFSFLSHPSAQHVFILSLSAILLFLSKNIFSYEKTPNRFELSSWWRSARREARENFIAIRKTTQTCTMKMNEVISSAIQASRENLYKKRNFKQWGWFSLVRNSNPPPQL